MGFNASTFREERMLRRSRQRVEAVQIEKAFDRAAARHERMKLKIREKDIRAGPPSSHLDPSCRGEVSAGVAITQKVTAEDEQVVPATLSNSLIDKGNYAEHRKKEMRSTDIKIKKTDAKLAPENAASTNHDPVVRSSKTVTYCNKEKESKAYEKSRQKDQAKLSSLLTGLEERMVCARMPDTMQQQLQQWVTSMHAWEESVYRSCVPVRVGAPRADTHHMREAGLTYTGDINLVGKPHGQGKVIFENGDWMIGEFKDGMRNGLGTLKLDLELAVHVNGGMENCKVNLIDATFVADQLEGPGKIEFESRDVLVCTFVQGVVHGFTKLFDSQKNLKHVCWYQNGLPYGYSWQFCQGGGFLVGELDKFGNFSGSNLAFLYPDLRTGLCGVFSSGRMVSAGPAAVQLATKKNNIFCLQFKRLAGSGYNFDLATREVISARPLLRDPYETEHVVVASCKDTRKGEGLFVRKSVPPNTILAFYNGTKLDGKDCIKSDSWEDDAYKIMDLLPTKETEPGVLDIPLEYQNTQNYCASLAHKANHSFMPNARFSLFQHPRFGPVPAIVSTASVPSGGEVLVNYEYAYDEAPPWFTALYSQQLADAYKLSQERDWEMGCRYQRTV